MRSLKVMLCSLCLLLPGLSLAAPSAPVAASTALSAASRTFTVGTLRVQQYGTHGRALILIPGLSSGPGAWQGTIAHFEKDHVIYALTLAGFDGTPAPKVKT
ncbi:MAG: alpha/beta fold hydrolase, partial [Ktedonobacteraceae bacterium]